jgi:MscS family membrane protein
MRSSGRARLRRFNCPARGRATLFALLLLASATSAEDDAHPLRPVDRSSPRAALQSFLELGDAVGAYLSAEYLPSPTRAKFHELVARGDTVVRSLDLSALPPATRQKAGRAAAMALYEVLSRIRLPAPEEIPGADAPRWVIPDTEIALVRSGSGPLGDEYLFSPDTVARAGDFFERVRGLPYTRPVPLMHMKDLVVSGGGWMIPISWVQGMPGWLRAPLAGQALWKWIALALVLGILALFLRKATRISRRGRPERPFLRALARLTLPASLLVATPVAAYLALVQINVIGGVGSTISGVTTAVLFLGGAWSCWRLAPVLAEAVIASPNISPLSIDAHLIRICTRVMGITGVAALLSIGADRLGVPVYGIAAGLGVGGLAIALAAQPTVENLIGGLSLFADRPIRVGDLCRYGGDLGTVEAIGLRSTRIRGLDRTLTTVPNAALAKMPLVNFAPRDRTLLRAVLGVRYETNAEQLRYLLARIRETLLAHPRILADPARARLIGFGASSLDIEVVAYVTTNDAAEFLAIQEDVLLRIMDVVGESGTGFAFPSQTLYFARDGGLDAGRTEAARTAVRRWREEGRLPFPDFPADHEQRPGGTVG